MKTGVTVTGIPDINRILLEVGPREGKNLIRATVHGMASELAKSAKRDMPMAEGAMKAGTKAKRERGDKNTVASTVRVSGAFYWRYLEYGQGPDGVEHAMFLKSLQAMRPDVDRVYLETFAKKLTAMMARKAKAAK